MEFLITNIIYQRDTGLKFTCWGLEVGKHGKSLFSIIKLSCLSKKTLCIEQNIAMSNKAVLSLNSSVLLGLSKHTRYVLRTKAATNCTRQHGSSAVKTPRFIKFWTLIFVGCAYSETFNYGAMKRGQAWGCSWVGKVSVVCTWFAESSSSAPMLTAVCGCGHR